MSFEYLFGETTGVELIFVYNTLERAGQTQGIAPELIAETKTLLNRANYLFNIDRPLAAEACNTAFLSARTLHFAVENRVAVEQKRALNASQRKLRGSRRPEIDAWIIANPTKTSKEIWDSIPTSGDGLLRDDNELLESGKASGIGYKAFQNRVSKLRNPD